MKKKPVILLTDDEQNIRKTLREILEFEGYEIIEASGSDEAMKYINQQEVDLMLLDIKMKGKDGLELLGELREIGFDFPIIMLTGHGTLDTAVQATRLGAYDFLQKPPDLNRLLICVRNALDQGSLKRENVSMRRKMTQLKNILGESAAIERIRKTINKVGGTDSRVLITGENGTGKEIVARWVHEYSKRSKLPFIEVNCAAIPSELLESELFGHEKGSFTGATKQRIGKFEEAHSGTLFLDEIGDMSTAAQAKVLRALQENVITRVGGNALIQVDVRIVSATNKNLENEIKEGRFREDLYHRLNVIPIHVPPLRERRTDIPILALAFLEELSKRDIIFAGKSFTNEAVKALQNMDWSGNVRELHNVVERLGILAVGTEITIDDINLILSKKKSEPNSEISGMLNHFDTFQDFKDASERIFIRFQLDKHEWNISATADHIGIQRSHLYNKIKKYELER